MEQPVTRFWAGQVVPAAGGVKPGCQTSLVSGWMPPPWVALVEVSPRAAAAPRALAESAARAVAVV